MRSVFYQERFGPKSHYEKWPDSSPPSDADLDALVVNNQTGITHVLESGQTLRYVRLWIDGRVWDCQNGWTDKKFTGRATDGKRPYEEKDKDKKDKKDKDKDKDKKK